MSGKDHCGSCRYFGFLLLDRWCRHPEHPSLLKKWGSKCAEWLDMETKNVAGKVYPEPVRLEQTLHDEQKQSRSFPPL